MKIPGKTSYSLKKRRKLLIFVSALALLTVWYYVTHSTIEGWGPDKPRWIPDYVHPEKDTHLLQIEGGGCQRPLTLLVVVFSAVNNYPQRAAIRSSWARIHPSLKVRVVFLIGRGEDGESRKEIESEWATHHDIVQEDFKDSYYNLTIKSVMMLKHIVRFCKNVGYVLKIDDDAYLHVENLMRLIKLLESSPNTDHLLGHTFTGESPIRNIFSKWYTPYYMHNGVFPTFVSGGSGYLMSRSTAVKLYESALVTPLFHLEDVFITGFCAKKANITPNHHPGFSLLPNPNNLCKYTSDVIATLIVTHDVSPDVMRKLWLTIDQKRDQRDCSSRKLTN